MMKKKFFVLLCSALLLILLTVEARAAVKADWDQPRGREVSFAMRISKAVPALVIVRLHLAVGLQVVEINPQPKKRDDKSKGLKLMFTNLGSGINRITITADRVIKRRDITGTVIYKDPITGAMEKTKIRW